MIKANDLMIGNLLQLDKEIAEVISFNEWEIRCEYEGNTDDFDINDFEPIKLTRDILRSLGYTLIRASAERIIYRLGAIDLISHTGGAIIMRTSNSYGHINVYYLHTLQNIHTLVEQKLDITTLNK